MRISDWSSDVCSSDLPPEDLVQSRMLQAEAREAVEDLARDTADGGPAVLLGAPWVDDGKLYNAMLLLDGGRVVTARYKVDLPNYGVFDEKRVFAAGPPPGPIDVRGVRIGVPICADLWTPTVRSAERREGEGRVRPGTSR